MFDITLRPLKDSLFDPLCTAIPPSITPLHLTLTAFILGISSCLAAAASNPTWAVSLWLLNRILDCLDGAVARHRNQASDLGGFLDLLGDFVVYSAIPISCGIGNLEAARGWMAVATVEATFHVNNFVLFYIAAVAEKQKASSAKDGVVKELTSVMMRPALVEGAESGVVFTVMLALPACAETLCWIMSAGVAVGTVQRVMWVVRALSKMDGEKNAE